MTGNLNPVGRVYYNASTQLCVPNALSQPGGYALGAQAGESAIRELVTDAGLPASGGPPRPRSTSSTRPARKDGQAPPGIGGRLAAFKGREQLPARSARAEGVRPGVPHA